MTLISVTPENKPCKNIFDQIILLMEGEVIAAGKHKTLRASCPEYVQIYESQRSTSHYEMSSDLESEQISSETEKNQQS